MIRIINIKDTFIYPIFKNGKSSIEHYAASNNCRWLVNEQCNRAHCITIFIRQPHERFISGVHSFIEFEKRKNKYLDYNTMAYCIQNHGVSNKHFMPQFLWIKQLADYYNKEIQCENVSKLLELIPNRDRPEIPNITTEQKDLISKIKLDELGLDELLFKNYIGKRILIGDLIGEIENALSPS